MALYHKFRTVEQSAFIRLQMCIYFLKHLLICSPDGDTEDAVVTKTEVFAFAYLTV